MAQDESQYVVEYNQLPSMSTISIRLENSDDEDEGPSLPECHGKQERQPLLSHTTSDTGVQTDVNASQTIYIADHPAQTAPPQMQYIGAAHPAESYLGLNQNQAFSYAYNYANNMVASTNPSAYHSQSTSTTTSTETENTHQMAAVDGSIENVSIEGAHQVAPGSNTNQVAPVAHHDATVMQQVEAEAESRTMYPIVYVSPAGLLTVLMKQQVAIEMTMDKTIRVVNHKHKSVAATNTRGNASCLYHSAVKVYQENTTSEADIYWGRKARMTTENIYFASGNQSYNLSIYGMHDSKPDFGDLSKDMSVSLLFSASRYGPHYIPAYRDIASAATYQYHKRGGTTVLINGMRIYQNSRGDVMVSCGPKYIRVSPLNGTMYLQTHFVEMALETNWKVRVKRGEQRMQASFQDFMVSDGYREAGFDQHGQMFYQQVQITWTTLIDNTVPPPPPELDQENQVWYGPYATGPSTAETSMTMRGDAGAEEDLAYYHDNPNPRTKRWRRSSRRSSWTPGDERSWRGRPKRGRGFRGDRRGSAWSYREFDQNGSFFENDNQTTESDHQLNISTANEDAGKARSQSVQNVMQSIQDEVAPKVAEDKEAIKNDKDAKGKEPTKPWEDIVSQEQFGTELKATSEESEQVISKQSKALISSINDNIKNSEKQEDSFKDAVSESEVTGQKVESTGEVDGSKNGQDDIKDDANKAMEGPEDVETCKSDALNQDTEARLVSPDDPKPMDSENCVEHPGDVKNQVKPNGESKESAESEENNVEISNHRSIIDTSKSEPEPCSSETVSQKIPDLIPETGGAKIPDLIPQKGGAEIPDLIAKEGASETSDVLSEDNKAETKDLIPQESATDALDLIPEEGTAETPDLIPQDCGTGTPDLIPQECGTGTPDLIPQEGGTGTPDLIPQEGGTGTPDLIPQEGGTGTPDLIHQEGGSGTPDLIPQEGGTGTPDLIPQEGGTGTPDLIPQEGGSGTLDLIPQEGGTGTPDLIPQEGGTGTPDLIPQEGGTGTPDLIPQEGGSGTLDLIPQEGGTGTPDLIPQEGGTGTPDLIPQEGGTGTPDLIPQEGGTGTPDLIPQEGGTGTPDLIPQEGGTGTPCDMIPRECDAETSDPVIEERKAETTDVMPEKNITELVEDGAEMQVETKELISEEGNAEKSDLIAEKVCAKTLDVVTPKGTVPDLVPQGFSSEMPDLTTKKGIDDAAHPIQDENIGKSEEKKVHISYEMEKDGSQIQNRLPEKESAKTIDLIPEEGNAETPDLIPGEGSAETPDLIPREGSAETPDLMPRESSAEIPDLIPREGSAETPDLKPEEGNAETPDLIPGEGSAETPNLIPGEGSAETPDLIPGEGSAETPDLIPGESSAETPNLIPGEGSAETPDLIPGEGSAETPDLIPRDGSAETPDLIPGEGSAQTPDLIT